MIQRKPGSVIRYLIKIDSSQGHYTGYIQKGHSSAEMGPKSFQLGPDDTVTIKDQDIALKDVRQALISYNKEWLDLYFDEQGQYAVGAYLYRQLFGELTPAEVGEQCSEVEILIVTEDEHIECFPWILLAHHGVFLSASGWSVALANRTPFVDCCELPPYPKMLVIAPEPADREPTKAKEHLEALKELISVAGPEKNFEVATTWDEFKEKIKTFNPHILYYYGHVLGNKYSSGLVFADKDKKAFEIPVADLVFLLGQMPEGPPLIVYVNSCFGEAGGLFSVRQQLSRLVPAVLTNRTAALLNAAQAQGMAFWEKTLIKAMPPHVAVSQMRSELVNLELSLRDIRWMTPEVHCHYDHWIAHPPKPIYRLERDPHWQLKLDRLTEFGQVYYQTDQMFIETKPKSLAYLWYGKQGQGFEYFHKRLKVELEEKLHQVLIYEVKPEWPSYLAAPDQSFRDMILKAFEINHLDQLTYRIRTFSKSKSKSKTGYQTLIHVCHNPVQSYYIFHPKYIKLYLHWWDLNFAPRLPEKVHALLGISYEIQKQEKLDVLISTKKQLDELELLHTVIQILPEMGKTTKKDLLDFLKTHNIILPPDIKHGILEKILKDTEGDYNKVLDKLIKLEQDSLIYYREKIDSRH